MIVDTPRGVFGLIQQAGTPGQDDAGGEFVFLILGSLLVICLALYVVAIVTGPWMTSKLAKAFPDADPLDSGCVNCRCSSDSATDPLAPELVPTMDREYLRMTVATDLDALEREITVKDQTRKPSSNQSPKERAPADREPDPTPAPPPKSWASGLVIAPRYSMEKTESRQ